MYAGSAETPVRIKQYGADRVDPGGQGFAQMHLRDPLPLEAGDRFVLRDAGRVLTFGGGVVLDPLAGRTRRDDRGRLDLLRRLVEGGPVKALPALVDAYGTIESRWARVRTGAEGPAPGVQSLGESLVSATQTEHLQDRLRAAVREHHRTHPLERGLNREGARAATGLGAREFDALVALTQDIAEEGALIRHADHTVELQADQMSAGESLIRRIADAGFTPPLAKELGGDAALLRALVDRGELVKIGDFYLTRRRAQEAVSAVRAAIEQRGPLTVAEIRDLLGTTRKYAVPLCEWLDATSVTRRQGDVRALGPTEKIG
jgi:selenocysteine-specific elongation factor